MSESIADWWYEFVCDGAAVTHKLIPRFSVSARSLLIVAAGLRVNVRSICMIASGLRVSVRSRLVVAVGTGVAESSTLAVLSEARIDRDRSPKIHALIPCALVDDTHRCVWVTRS